MKYRWDKKYLYWGITGFLVIVTSILFFQLLSRFDVVADGLNFIGGILMPFVVAFVLAYLLSPIVDFFERRCFLPLWNRLKRRDHNGEDKPDGGNVLENAAVKRRKPPALPRALAIFVTLLLAAALVAGLIGMIIPQLADSITGILKNMNTYIGNLQTWVTDMTHNSPELEAFLNSVFVTTQNAVTDWAKNLLPQVSTILSGVTTGVKGLVSFLMNTCIGVIVAIYVLFSKEKFAAQAKKLCYALFSVRFTNGILRITRRADRMFGGFIKGKLIDSAIIGCLCFVCMTLFSLILPQLALPYILLISVIIGIFNIIPFFGPIIGAIPSALLILVSDITNPLKCVCFIIIIVVIQQFDGNILGPRILGGSTGLSAFWVTFAIVVAGGLFGFAGMVLGVPTFALFYSFLAEFTQNRLKKQALPVDTGDYDSLDHIVAEGEEKSAVYMPPNPPKPEKPVGKTRSFRLQRGGSPAGKQDDSARKNDKDSSARRK